jgi:hypothetical protein
LVKLNPSHEHIDKHPEWEGQTENDIYYFNYICSKSNHNDCVLFQQNMSKQLGLSCFFGEEEICYDDDHGNQHPSDSDQNYQEEYDCDDDGSTTNETPLTPDLSPTPSPPNVSPAARVGKCNLGSKYRSLINNYGPTFEGKRSSSNQDINSAGSHACWEVMDKDQLIAECKQRGLKADRRHATQTLIQNLQVWEKQN